MTWMASSEIFEPGVLEIFVAVNEKYKRRTGKPPFNYIELESKTYLEAFP